MIMTSFSTCRAGDAARAGDAPTLDIEKEVENPTRSVTKITKRTKITKKTRGVLWSLWPFVIFVSERGRGPP
jgi:hypothetical protein